MKFGDILRELLEQQYISQKQLASNLNIAVSTLENYIRNLREPDYATLKKIAEYFNVSIDYLLDYHPDNASSHQDRQLLQIFHSLTEEQKLVNKRQNGSFLSIALPFSAYHIYSSILTCVGTVAIIIIILPENSIFPKKNYLKYFTPDSKILRSCSP